MNFATIPSNWENWIIPRGKLQAILTLAVNGRPQSQHRGRVRAGIRKDGTFFTAVRNPNAKDKDEFARNFLPLFYRYPQFPWQGGSVFVKQLSVFPWNSSCYPDREHIQRPDLDNLAKLVWDAATSHLWRDDCQVTSTWQGKRFTNKPDGWYGVVLEVRFYEEHPNDRKNRIKNLK